MIQKDACIKRCIFCKKRFIFKSQCEGFEGATVCLAVGQQEKSAAGEDSIARPAVSPASNSSGAGASPRTPHDASSPLSQEAADFLWTNDGGADAAAFNVNAGAFALVFAHSTCLLDFF